MEEYDERYLRADYSLLCGTSEHKSYMVYSIVMMLVSVTKLSWDAGHNGTCGMGSCT